MHRNSSLSCSQIEDPRGSVTSVQEVGMLSSANTTSKQTYLLHFGKYGTHVKSDAVIQNVFSNVFVGHFQTSMKFAYEPPELCLGVSELCLLQR